jgi:hypothetical protein
VKSDSEKEQSTVSVNDQSILFYIAGFIIKALKLFTNFIILIFSVCQFDPIPIRPINDTILSIEM